MPSESAVVAVVNTNPDIVRLLRVSLERSGYVTFAISMEDTRNGSVHVKALLDRHNPDVIIHDIAPPYEQNWRFLDQLRSTGEFAGRRFVITSVNARAAQQAVGRQESVYEVLGQDTDVLQIVRAVKEATRARPTR